MAIQNSMFKPRRLGHVNMFVSNVEKSVDFYNNICGLEKVRMEPAIRGGFLSNGNTHHDIGLIEVSNKPTIGRDGHLQPSSGRGTKPGINHFGFEMENEAILVEAYECAKKAGVKIHATTDHLLSRSVYVFDPDGILLEFYADTVEDWRTIFNPDREDLVSGPWVPGEEAPIQRALYPVNPEIRRVDHAVFHPSRISHVTIVPMDFERSVRFYKEVGGLEEIGTDADRSITVLRGTAGGWHLILLRPNDDLKPGLHHFGFQLEDESELVTSEGALKKKDVAVDRHLKSEGRHSIFINDPDQNRVEFYYDGSGDIDRRFKEKQTGEARGYMV